VQGGEAAHRETDDVRALEAHMVEHGDRIVARVLLRVARRLLGNIGRRKAARVVGDAAKVAREEA